VKATSLTGRLSLAFLLAWSCAALAKGSGDPEAVKAESGKYYDVNGDPTFNVKEDGTVDWLTYSGFRHYESECLVCHGPEGEGSPYAPALRDALTTLSYAEVYAIVARGQHDTKIPAHETKHAFGDVKNVMCYLNDIYVYLRAKANDAVPRGLPRKREAKLPETAIEEQTCLGTGKS